ncbi:MAG: glycoside hydrolase family 15 protein, partial [Janthinobacterium lividum]
IGDQGTDNYAWAGEYKGVPMLLACRDDAALALATNPPPRQQSVGYIGKSDGYAVLSKNKALPEANMAGPGNVGITAELDLSTPTGPDGEVTFLVALACGGDPAEAGQQARAGSVQDFDKTCALFVQEWQREQSQYDPIEDLSGSKHDLYRVSTAMLQTHQSKRFPGGFVASLSLPWGFERTDQDVGGYHVVWPRDLVESAMGKLACGDACSARSALFYLACTQDGDGGWTQNMWLDGTPHWGAIQMDGIALPVLLADKLRRDDALDGYDPRPMMHKAASFLLKNGPVTEQDRWETSPGFSPYTMAVQIAALLAIAECAELQNAPERAQFVRETADAWNDAIDELTYVEGTPLARQHGVRGYYVRFTPPSRLEERETGNLRVLTPNRPFWKLHPRAIDTVSPDALALVRFGVRAADDPRMIDTAKVIDAMLKRETATGQAWRRSTNDGYGEQADGSPFGKIGIGRSWPLLAGERGHFEIAAGRREQALELLKTMSRQTSECGLLPEQIWDTADLPDRELFNGHPSGSGMPLAWAHAEYIKLLRSLHANAIWDAVPQTMERYVTRRHPARFQIWRPKQRRGFVTAGKDLRIDLDVPSRLHWRLDRVETETETTDSGMGLHTATLALATAQPGSAVRIRVEPIKPTREAQSDAFIVRIRDGNGNGT